MRRSPKSRSHLGPRQREITERIRAWHAEGMPLNICAVKRRSPELLAEVFALRPFWGWWRAVQDAGLSYDELGVELAERVRCELCGLWRRSLGTHLRKIHGLERGEYAQHFPGAPVHSAVFRARLLGPGRLAPHWEPCWSAEYVADRIRFLHDQHHPVHIDALHDVEPTLVSAAARYWGGWDRALVAAGLDPDEIRQARPCVPYPPAAEILDAIRQRLTHGLPIGTKAVFHQDGRLMCAACKEFGSWRKALAAAGLDPAAFIERHRRRSDVLPRLFRLARQAAAIQPAEKREASLRRLREKFNGIVYRQFGGWAALAERLGLPAYKLTRSRRYTPETVALALRERRAQGKSLAPATLYSEDRPLYRAATLHFGSLEKAYRASGLETSRRQSTRRSSPRGTARRPPRARGRRVPTPPCPAAR